VSTLVVYVSAYGNTEVISQVIGNTLRPQEDARVVRVNDVTPDQFKGLKLLVVGSPTQRFRPTIGMMTLLKSIPQNGLKGVKIAAFDTRLTEAEINKVRILAFFVRIYGYAAKPIVDRLKKKGGELIMPPEGFYVEGMEGPLVAGELERAAEWAKGMKNYVLN
jgi:flavodoxin